MSVNIVSDEQILAAIRELSQKGYPLSMREVGKKLGRTISTIYSRLSRLRDQGKIRWEPTQPRTLRVLQDV